MEALKHAAYFLLFFLALGAHSLRAQGYQPINAFHPEQDYPGTSFQSTENLLPTEFIRKVLGDFELGRERMIAILVNGQYEARVHGNGDFDEAKVPQRLNEKIVLSATERVEARFCPALRDLCRLAVEGPIHFPGHPGGSTHHPETQPERFDHVESEIPGIG